MACGEFDLISRYFQTQNVSRRDVNVPIGDDCAILTVPEGNQLAVTTDTLVAGTHFLACAPAELVAHKALAANLSDLAAMGATPAWVSLALTLPEPDEAWVKAFCDGFFKLAEYFNVQLIGGDTTKGDVLSITITAQGVVPAGTALTRGGASIGDWVYVTGNLGDSAAGLDAILGGKNATLGMADVLCKRHYKRTPRVLAGQSLRSIASACVDISDGLVSDLGHILNRSGVSAVVDAELLPMSAEFLSCYANVDEARRIALTSGEEYELCFTVSEQNKGAVQSALTHSGVSATCIGQIRPGSGLKVMQGNREVQWDLAGYDHFRSDK